MINRASFAVVGHPNKGKSSIVSTLCRNDSVLISSQSGTTTQADRYRVELEDAGYELIDTPGFQRPTKVLNWLKKRAASAAERASCVADFVNDADCKRDFPDEVELLSPIVKGAAILYVVDGSRPFGREYEAEMEILRWTGQPSMALINPIEDESHVEEWRSALMQYFKTVQVFNPMSADFKKQKLLLETFAYLNPQWSANLSTLLDNMQRVRENQKRDCAEILARLVEDLCFYTTSQKVMTEAQAEKIQPVLDKQYQNWMTDREQKAISELFAVYSHFQIDFNLQDLDLPPHLFDQQAWFAWGLNKKQLATAATIAGASAGAAIDLVVAGQSFMLGAIGGGVVGFSSAWFGADKLVKTQIKGVPLGGFEATVGPVNNANFPYVVIGRFIYMFSQISEKNHADRNPMDFKNCDLQSRIDLLEKSSKTTLHKACRDLSRQKGVDQLNQLLLALFD